MTTFTRTDCRSCSPTVVSGLLIALFALVARGDAPTGRAPYALGAGDVVQVEVWREADLSGSFAIDVTGALQHVLLGAVPASGLTCLELAEELRRKLERDYVREPRVVVTLEKSARRRAWILGPVAKPGSYPVGDGTRLLDLLFAAGGLQDGVAGRAVVYRMGDLRSPEELISPMPREPLAEFSVDLRALLAGDLAMNQPIAAGDLLVVSPVSAGPDGALAPVATGRVRVVGAVESPGAYSLSEAPTVLDALLVAGGFSEYAAGNRARLVRGAGEDREERKLKLGDIVSGRKGAENIAVQDGDLLVVPESFF